MLLPLLILGLAGTFTGVRGQLPIDYSLTEESEPGPKLGNIIQDAQLQLPQDDTISFTILPAQQDSHELFKVEADGSFVQRGRVDRDALCPQAIDCEIQLDIEVSSLTFFEIAKVTIQVYDINDETPSFTENIYTLEVSEAASSTSSIILPRAIDLDSPGNGVVTYREADLDQSKFVLANDSSNDPILVIKDTLDREDTPSYQFILLAADSQAPGVSASATVRIELLDVNDNFPQFTKELYETTSDEKVSANRSLIQVSASDKDSGENGKVFYYLSPETKETYGDLFNIDQETGDIRTNGQLDYETTQEAMLTVIARNREPTSPSSQARVSIRVIDINDESPSIIVNKEPQGGVFTVPENASLGTFVAHIKVTDPDTGEGGLFTCTLNDNNFVLVKLHDTDFKVVTDKLFDRENRADYKVTITCTDGGNPSLSSSREINMQLIDINDNYPVCGEDPFTVELVENESRGDMVLTIVATDKDIVDNGRLSYEIAAGPASETARRHLFIDPLTGDVTVAEPFNYEQVKLLTFNVTVSDHGDPRLTSDCAVKINVTDVDDEYPMFEEVVYEMELSETDLPGHIIGSVKANDLDSEAFSSVTYNLVDSVADLQDGSLSDKFIIDSNTGEISINSTFDRETKSNYTLTVQAMGDGPNYLQTDCHVLVKVTDINDNNPVMIFPNSENFTVFVKKHLEANTFITKIIATDSDEGDNSRLNYHIVSEEEELLSIDSLTGDITTSKDYSASSGHTIRVLIHVTDSGHPQLSNSSDLLLDFSLDADPLPLVDQTSARNANIVIIIAVLSGVLMVVLATAIFWLVMQRRRGKRKQTKVQTFQQEVSTVYTAASAPQPPQYGVVNKALTLDDDALMQQPENNQKQVLLDRGSVLGGDQSREGSSGSSQKVGECASEGSDSGHGSNEESNSLPGTLKRWDNRLLTAAVTRQESHRIQSSQSFRSDSTAPPELPPRKRRISQSFQFRFPTDPYPGPGSDFNDSQSRGASFSTHDDLYKPEYTPTGLENMDYSMYDRPKDQAYPSGQPPPPYSSDSQYPPTDIAPVFQFKEEDNNEGVHKEEFVDFINIPGYNPYGEEFLEPPYNEQRIYSPDEVFQDDSITFGSPVHLSDRVVTSEKPSLKYCSQV